MAQREQHERVKRMDRLADKLLGHKAVVMAILVVIAMASGLAMANLGGGAGSVSFEHTDGSGSLVEPGSGDASSGKTSEGSSPKASAAAEVYVDVDGAVLHEVGQLEVCQAGTGRDQPVLHERVDIGDEAACV